MEHWLFAVVLSALAGTASILGGLVAVYHNNGSSKFMPNTMAAVAGFLLAAAFLDLIPETAEAARSALVYVFVGYLIVYLAESLFPAHTHAGESVSDMMTGVPHHHSPHYLDPKVGIAASIGLAVHSYFDGVALTAGAISNTGTGLLLLAAISIHQLPVGFGLVSIMRAAGFSRLHSLFAAMSLFAATVVGGITAALITLVDPGVAVVTLAFSAGTFIYIGATDMIPATHSGGSRYSVLYSLAGAAVFVLTSAFLRHSGLG